MPWQRMAGDRVLGIGIGPQVFCICASTALEFLQSLAGRCLIAGRVPRAFGRFAAGDAGEEK